MVILKLSKPPEFCNCEKPKVKLLWKPYDLAIFEKPSIAVWLEGSADIVSVCEKCKVMYLIPLKESKK